jgi:hypothetical protein
MRTIRSLVLGGIVATVTIAVLPALATAKSNTPYFAITLDSVGTADAPGQVMDASNSTFAITDWTSSDIDLYAYLPTGPRITFT